MSVLRFAVSPSRCVCIATTAVFWCVLGSGCGSQDYEDRLAETQLYFKYLDTLNKNLGGLDAITADDGKTPLGIQLRPPKGFVRIPAPKIEIDEEGNEIFPEFDPRQPAYIDQELELPGLVAAWQSGSGELRSTSYIYVLSNHSRWTNDEGEDPAEFINEGTQQLFEGFRAPSPAAEQWAKETIPRGHKFVSAKTLDVTTQQTTVEDQQIGLTVYLYVVNDIQVILVFVIPLGGEPAPRRIDMCLETLIVTGQQPRPPGQEPAPGTDIPF